MSFPVVTGTFGTITAGGSVLSWDTADPAGDGPAEPGRRYVVDGLTAGWAIDVLPPVASPTTVNFSVYQNEADDLGTWMPFAIGDPIAVQALAYHPDLGSVNLWQFKGRVADIKGTNHPAGGIVFNVVCVDRLADLPATNAPSPLYPNISVAEPIALYDAYRQITVDAGVDFDEHAGENTDEPDWQSTTFGPIDLTNVSTFDALSLAITQDVRLGVSRYLTQQIDTGTTDPEAVARYRLNEWNPEDVDDLAGVLGFHWTGTGWILIPDTAYAGSGMVLSASQLALDVGSWSQTRDQATNTIELTYPTDPGETAVTRVSFADLVAAYGPNGRSVDTWLTLLSEVRAQGAALLISRDQVQTFGFGFDQLTVAWETLNEDQLLLWGDELFNIFGTSALGKPFAVVDIPDSWKLAPGPAVTGRLMGVQMVLSEGVVRIQLQTRAVPPSAVDGVTFDDVAAFAHPITPNNVDPTITIDQLAVTGHDDI